MSQTQNSMGVLRHMFKDKGFDVLFGVYATGHSIPDLKFEINKNGGKPAIGVISGDDIWRGSMLSPIYAKAVESAITEWEKLNAKPAARMKAAIETSAAKAAKE